jgi:hypothetical protein
MYILYLNIEIYKNNYDIAASLPSIRRDRNAAIIKAILSIYSLPISLRQLGLKSSSLKKKVDL